MDMKSNIPNLFTEGIEPGNEEFQDLKRNGSVDMGDIPSRDLGDMLSGQLVAIGKSVLQNRANKTE